MQHAYALFAAAAIAAFAPSQTCPGPAQPAWAPVPGLTTQPSVRRSGAMCFDGNVPNRLILYGGVSPTPSVILNETWAFNGTAWSQLTPAPAAPYRWGHQMVRHAELNRIVTFGGRSPTISGFASDSYQWNGSAWSVIPASNPPPPRFLYGMAYDSVRKKIVVFGGRGTLTTLGDTWELTNDGVTWSWQLITTPTSPPPREEMVLAYMPDQQRTVMFGGYDRDTDTIYNDTWEYDGTKWVQASPVMPQDPNPELTPRYRMASAYDTARRRIMIYGGFDGNSVRTETFEYTGAEWQPIAAAGGSLFATEMYAAYDITRREFITFGGTGGSIVGFGNQTHEYTPRCTAFFSQYGEGCDTTSVGIAAVSVLDPDGPGPVPPSLPRLGQTYQMQFSNIPATTPFPSFVIVAVGLSNTSFNGLPLPFPLSVLGLPAECNLLCSLDLVQVLAAPSGLVTVDVPIPSNNALFNMPIYSQAIIGGPVLFPLVGASRGGVGVIGI